MKKLLLVTALLSIGSQSFAAVCHANLQTGRGKIVQTFSAIASNQALACTQALGSCNYDFRQKQLDGKMHNGECLLVDDVASLQPITSHHVGNVQIAPSFQYEIDQLENIYASVSPQTRRYAVEQLSNYPSVRALKMSINALNDYDDEVNSAAIVAFNQLLTLIDFYYNDQLIIEEMSIILKDNSSKKRKAAAIVLGEVKTAMAAIPLIEAATESDEEVIREIQVSLNQVMQNMDVKIVEEMIRDIFATQMASNDYKKRVETIKVISMVNAPITVGLLVKAVGDYNSQVSSEAKRAVNKLINSSNYISIEFDMIMSLSTHLRNKNSQVRIYTIKALGSTHHPAARESLLKALDNYANWGERLLIEEALSIL